MQYVTVMLKVYQMCHSLSCCVKNGSHSSSLEWKSMDSVAGTSYYLDIC